MFTASRKKSSQMFGIDMVGDYRCIIHIDFGGSEEDYLFACGLRYSFGTFPSHLAVYLYEMVFIGDDFQFVCKNCLKNADVQLQVLAFGVVK